MAGKSGKGQRANKSEKLQAEKVLKEIWLAAFKDGEWKQEFQTGTVEDTVQANILYNALADYRKKVRRKASELFDVHLAIDSCSLKKPNDRTVLVERKPSSYSDRTTILMNIAQNRPELGLTAKNEEPTIDNILKDFFKNSFNLLE